MRSLTLIRFRSFFAIRVFDMEIYQAGSRPSLKARADWFTGTVWQDEIIETPDPARLRAVQVHFEPGARTAWHTHPLGQTLLVTFGVGRIGLRDQPPRVIRPGDTVWIPPGEEHWHGAAPDCAMTHLALHEAQEGRVAVWLDPVADEDYLIPAR